MPILPDMYACKPAIFEATYSPAALAAGQATAAQQGAAYAALPEPDIAVGNDGRARIYTRKDIVGEPYYTAGQLHAFADATHTLRASHGQASSQAGEYPALVCDYCGALTPDPWHSSGMLHGKMSKHIHSCDACAARGATQPQAGAVPLTDEQIRAMLNKHPPEDVCGWSYRMGIDDAELHHGIKGGQHGAE